MKDSPIPRLVIIYFLVYLQFDILTNFKKKEGNERGENINMFLFRFSMLEELI